MARADPWKIVFTKTAVFLPEAAGRPPDALITGSRRSSTSGPPQPLAPGADHALSTSVAPLVSMIRPSSRNSTSPSVPEIGLFGGGGEVVPEVNFHISGLALEPT